jgi:hypothetical protein
MTKEPKVTDFVKETLKELSAGVPEKFRLDSKIFFELSVVSSKKKGGGVDIKVVSGSASQEVQNVQKIKFSVTNEESEKKDLKAAGAGIKALFSGFGDLVREYPELMYDEDKTQVIETKPTKRKKKSRR